MAKKTNSEEILNINSVIQDYEKKIKDLENTVWLQRQGQSLLRIEKLEEKISDLNSLIRTLHETLQWLHKEFEFTDECGCAEKGSSHIESMCPFHISLLYCNKFFENKEQDSKDCK